MIGSLIMADNHTLLIAMGFVAATIGLAIAGIAQNTGKWPLRLWASSMLFGSVCYFLFALRYQAPAWVSIIVANVFLACAHALSALAIARLCQRTIPSWLVGWPILAIGLLFWWFLDNQQVRFTISSGIFFYQLSLMVYLLQGDGNDRKPGWRLLTWTLSIMAAMHLLRLGVYAFGLAPTQSINTPSSIQTITYLLAIATLLLSSLGFLFMVKEQADQALVASEAHFRAFFERSMVGMATVAPDRTWITVNPALCQMLGYTQEELLHTTWDFLTLPEDIDICARPFERVLAGEINEYEIDKRYVRKDGSTIYVHLATRGMRHPDGHIEHFIALIQDISTHKADEAKQASQLAEMKALNYKLESAQNQLLQSDKLASLGLLAAGVAHEINNPIGFIKSNLGTLRGYINDLFLVVDPHSAPLANQETRAKIDLDFLRTDLHALLDESSDGIERVRYIVQNLKDFSRMGETEWRWADIHQGIDSTLNIIWHELKYKCSINRQYGELPQVYCVPSQLNQVFMNLLANAGHAIQKQGEISIRTECLGTDQIRICISDTGSGIALEDINRIFDPFFTTKPVGKGTGLGLSLVWSIVEKHHGQIEVTSQPGHGTTFTLTLPIQQQESAAAV